MKKLLYLLIVYSCQALSQDSVQKAQTAFNDSAMNLIIKDTRSYTEASFKAPRVIMTHSIEMVKPGVMDFIILHRFGNLSSGAGELFGLDHATIRLGFDYGISHNLSVGFGRSSFKKEIDEFIKYRLIQQATGPGSSPVSLIVVGGNTIQTLKVPDAAPAIDFIDRLGYYAQALIGRKFSESFSLQVAPTYVKRNLVKTKNDPYSTYAMGIGGRIKLSRRISLNLDYYHVFNKDKSADTFDPFSIGIDIETGGHVFQLHITNATGMNERAFITETVNNWRNGDLQFGFNISRAFQIKKKHLTF